MKILIAGDFVPRHRVAEQINAGNYKCLDEVKSLVQMADYSIVNFESPVVEHDAQPIYKAGPNLSCSAKAVECVKAVGFNGVTLANNHFLDYGEVGVYDTLNTCKALNVDVMGGGINIEAASRIHVIEKEESRVAIINCCEHEYSIATTHTPGSNPLNPINQYYAIKEARKNADYVLVIVHGGYEMYQLPLPRMVETYKFFIDAGADAVVNHHQHCFSGYEIYKGKPIFYGLGNFCFDRPGNVKIIWNEGYMVTINFGKKIGFEIHPYIQCADEPKVKMMEKSIYKDKLDKLNAIIQDEIRLKEETERFFSKKDSIHSQIFEPILNSYWLSMVRRGWLPSLISSKRMLQAENYICCESLRDGLFYYLSKK